jgi:glycosyltransferase involved in cell wall biosynthesis
MLLRRVRVYMTSEKTDVVLNALPIRMGGGQQKVLSLLLALEERCEWRERVVVVVAQGSEAEEACRRLGLRSFSVGAGYAARARFESTARRHFARGQVCFTLSGPPMLTSPGYLLNLAECAYSFLFYPEVAYRKNLRFVSRFRMSLVDRYRKELLRRADYWLFQNEAIRRRAVNGCGFPEHRTAVVRVAPSLAVSPESVDAGVVSALQQRLPDGPRVLFLSSAYPNKRLHLVPELALAMKRAGCEKFCFVMTFDEKTEYGAVVVRRLAECGVSGHVVNLGTVRPGNVASVISVCDAMAVLSEIESFTNNFLEAWKMGRPMIATEADWARDAGGDAVLYVDPEDIDRTALEIMRLLASPTRVDALVQAGKKRLTTYNTPQQKLMQYWGHIDRLRALGPAPVGERRMIDW